MSELLNAFGINIKALIFQTFNFGVVLLVLTIFVYRPLVKYVEERRKKIQLGIEGGEKAAVIIKEAESTKASKIREGETQAVAIISGAEAEGQKRQQEIVHGAEKRGEYIVEEALAQASRRKQEELENLTREAQEIIKAALIKTVQLDPKQIDDKLISKALHEIHS